MPRARAKTDRPPRALLGAAGLVGALLCGVASCAEGSESRPPNVLFVLADDLRWDALGIYGNEIVKTPELDALGREGLVLDAFYVANPVCNASRAAFLSGRYTFQRGVLRPAYRTLLDAGTPTVASLLERAGYRTGFVGKAHLNGDPRSWGFREVPLHTPGLQAGDPLEVLETFYADGERIRIRGDPTPRIADAAIRFLERHRGERWFLWIATTAPHWPLHYNEAHPYSPDEIVRPPGYPPAEPLGPLEEWADYYSVVSTLDEQIGRVLARLDELGLRDETLVFFTSDNGLMAMSHGVAHKAVWFEESVRQPAILRWPGRIEPGRRSDALVSSVDLLPTLLAIAGLPAPEGLEGRSLLPLLESDRATREQVFAESVRSPHDGGGTWQMVREGSLKLVQFTDRRQEHLYDLASDPHETRDLVGQPELAEPAERLRARLRSWRETTR